MKQKLFGALRVLVSVGILAYLFNGIFGDEARKSVPDLDEMPRFQREAVIWTKGPHALWEVFQKVNAWWFVLAVALMGIVCLLGIVRWRMILRVQGLELSFWRTTSIFFVGAFFNAFLLGSTGGDVIKAWYVAHETHHKKAEAVATVVVDRLIGLLALFVLTLIMMAIYHHRVFDDPKLITFSIITLTFVLSCVAVTVLGFWRGFADKVPGLRKRLQRLPKYDTLKRMIEAYRQYATHRSVLLYTTLQSFGVHLTVMIGVWCIGQGLRVVTDNGIVDYLLYLPSRSVFLVSACARECTPRCSAKSESPHRPPSHCPCSGIWRFCSGASSAQFSISPIAKKSPR
jgi:uncharacterized protein (TIRG00374 family)